MVTKKATLFIQIYAPTIDIKQSLKDKGILSKKGKPLAFNLISKESDKTIVSWYAFLAQRFLTYYSCADNYYKISAG